MSGAKGRLTGIVMFASAAVVAAGIASAQQTSEQTTAQPADAASNVTPYKPAFFSQFRPNTAMDMIGRIPGFSFDSGSDARGFSGTGGNVLIDGERPPSRDDSLQSIISRIPASGVERIDVIRGGADGIDMQGRAIMANVIRKKDAGLSGSVAANLNVNAFGGASPNTQIQVRNQSGGQLLDGSIGLLRNQGNGANRSWRVSPAGNLLRLAFAGSDNLFQSAEATGAWETVWLGGKLRVNGQASIEQFDGYFRDILFVPGGEQINDVADRTGSGEAGVRYSRTFGGGLQFELVGFQSLKINEFANTFSTPTFLSGEIRDSEAGESIARASMRFPPAGDWIFDGGLEVVFNFKESSAARSLNGLPFDLAGDDNRGEELRGELFGTATWAPSNTLSIETGLRYEWSHISAENELTTSEKTLSYVKPRFNVSWSPQKGHQWGLEVERVVDQLDFDSFASSAAFETEVFGVGNTDIEPQKNWVIGARYERQFGGQNSIVVKLSHATIEDFIARAVVVVAGSGTSLETNQNVGTATRDSVSVDSQL